MSEWKEVSLSEMGKTITGKTPPSQYPEDFGDEMPFITPSDSFEKKYINKSDRFLSRSGSDRLKEKIISPNSIMVTCIGSAMGKVAKNSLSSVTNQQINSIIVNENFDSDYIYYLLKNNYAVLRNAASGSTAIPILNKTDFDNLRFKVKLNLNEQRKMVSILSTIDDKIEINNQINQELEAMAKTLYDYWFVQFDFPDQNGKPYKSSGGKMVYHQDLKREIPEGWGVEKLGDITICHDSKRVPLSSNDRELVKGEIPYYGATGIMDYVNNYIFDGDYVLMAEDGSVMTEEGTPILQRISGKNWVNNHAHVLEPIKNHSCKLLMMLLKDVSVMKIKTGSIQMKINQENMNKIVVPAIPLELLSEINQKLEVIDKQQLTLIEENKQLTQLRDWLLPMLMNGQVKVER